MTKAELIEEVSRVVDMTRKDSEVIVEAILGSVVRALRQGFPFRRFQYSSDRAGGDFANRRSRVPDVL